MTLTPSISLSEEYNDNIFSNNANRQWDFITSLTPAVTLVIDQRRLQLLAGYSLSADLYARNYSDLSRGLDQQHLVFQGIFTAAPGLSFSASDTFLYNYNTNLIGNQGFSVGRQESWSNDATLGMSWQMTPRNRVDFSVSYGLLRFVGEGSGVDSDSYGIGGSVGHAFTPRLSGSLSYQFTYINPDGQDDSMTHTPMLGFTYQFTPTLTGSIDGGPSITIFENDTALSPSASASLTKVFGFGSAGVAYTRTVDVAGGFGGTNDMQTISAALTISTLARGLVVTFNPRYNIVQPLGTHQGSQVDGYSIIVYLAANYQLSRYVSLFGEYQFFRQRPGGAPEARIDVDQNRVRFGLQFGYPFSFD